MAIEQGATSSSNPPCRLLVRTKTNVVVYTVPERKHDTVATSPQQLWEGRTTHLCCTAKGHEAYLLTSTEGVVKCDLATNETTVLQDTKSVQVISLSPSGLYAVTWERCSEATSQNLKVFREGQLMVAFPQKSFKRDAWPSLQFTHDEQFAFLITASEIRVYPIDRLQDPEPRYVGKFHLPNLTSFSLPSHSGSKGKYLFATFCSKSKDQPAKASMYEYVPGDNAFRLTLTKSLFQAEEMKALWSPGGDSVLITLQTSVDASGQSYYGSSQLFLFSAGPGGDVIAVPVEAPVLDVAWMPNPNKPPCFAVISGKMPAQATLHHGQTAQPIFIFGKAHRNTIVWAPHGRFLTLAGFGNLAGGMGFWDRNKMKLIPHSPANSGATLKAENSTSYGWSPDSRLFVTATCSPRLNVDNGIRLWRYTGEELTNVPWTNKSFQPDLLLQVQFIPALIEAYPDRPQTPVDSSKESTTEVEPITSAAPIPERAAYVPPSARNRASGRGTSLAERLRREKEGIMQQPTKVVTPSVAQPAAKAIPGMAPQAKSKNALKKEKAKIKKQQQEGNQDQSNAAASPAIDVPSSQSASPAVDDKIAMEPEKRARKLKKILKQIDDLKLRSFDTLNDDQKSKIASEPEVRAELAQLNVE